MKKCASHSAHAGESNATFTGPVGLLRTQPPSVLSIHPHHIGFFENFAHTHTRGCVFCQNRSMLENQQKFRKMWKNVHPIQRTGLVRVVSSSSFGCLFRFPHPNPRPTRYPLHTVWVGIRWILQKGIKIAKI